MRPDDVQSVAAQQEAGGEQEEGQGDGEAAGDDLTERSGSGNGGGRPEGDINFHECGVYAREGYGRLRKAIQTVGTRTAAAQR